MNLRNLIFPLGLALFCFVIACTKNPTPTPPIHDTTVIKQTDTLYTVKPDSTVNLKKGLLLYLPFSGNMADSSGNGNLTTAFGGAALVYDEHGYANNAFGGTGNGARIKVTNNGSIKYDTTFSLSYDFMVNTVSTRQTFISVISTTDGYAPGIATGLQDPNVPFFNFSTNGLGSGCDNPGDKAFSTIDTTTFTPQISRWYNVLCTWNKGTEQVFLNGKLISTKTGPSTSALLCPSAQIVIGGWWDGDPITINGALDEVRLYNRVLTPHEITTLSQNFQVTSTIVHSAPVIR